MVSVTSAVGRENPCAAWRSLIGLATALLPGGPILPLYALQQQDVDRPVIVASAQDASSNAQADDDGPDKRDPLKRKGELQKIAVPIGKLVRLDWNDGRLEVHFAEGTDEINTSIEELRQLSGHGGGSSSWGSNTFEFSLDNEELSGRYARVQRDRTTDSLMTLLIQEEKSMRRCLTVEKTAANQTQITINDSEIGFLLRVRQKPDGTFSVQELRGIELFSDSAPSFDAFCRRHRDYVLESLVPVFEHFGLGTMQTPYSPHIQQLVVEALRPWSGDELNRIDELTRGLDSGVYADRQAASQRLDNAVAENALLLLRVVLDKRFPPETRARTRTLLRNKLDEKELREMDFVAGLIDKLNATWLMELVELNTDPEQRNVLLGELRTMVDSEMVTSANGEFIEPGDSGDLVALIVHHGMQNWVSDQVGVAEREAEPDLMAESGEIEKVAAHTGKLVRLAWQGDQLTVDREHWAEPFGGKSIKELIDGVEKSIADANLPPAWFQGGGQYSKDSVSFPQVLFEQLSAAGGRANENVHMRQYHYSGNQNASPNRQFDSQGLSGRMEFLRANAQQQISRAVDLEGKPFLFSLEEKSSPARTLLVDESKPGKMRILLTGEDSNFIVQLILDDKMALIQDIRGTRVRALQAPTFRQLLREEQAYFRDSFFPLIRDWGIEVDESVFAQPDANERTRP